ncbi:MAG: flagellar filament capping protein FliD [Chthoniobacter sp.]|nr:flagellar filament capping protein FliD [Chthoniobacter sp.]
MASGLDWRSLIDKLMAAERTPQDRLRAEKAAGAQKSTAISTLKDSLTALQTSLKALSETNNAFGVRSATIANANTTWTASAAVGTATGTYQIQTTQLATKAQRLGTVDAGRGLSATSDVSGLTLATLPVGTTIRAGEFTVNGARITVAVTDSLQDVFNQISTQTGGAVTASYDPVADKVQLSSAGEIVLGSANDSSNFLGALQLYNNGTGSVLPPTALGVVSVSAAIANANLKTAVTGVDGSGNGSFSINGVSIDFNVNNDNVQNVMARINASNAGVTASFDRVNDRFTLTNKTTGDVGVAISEGPGGLLASLGLSGAATLVRGTNAQFNVDGGPTLTSISNTFDETSHGITGLTVVATSQTTESVTVAGDSSAARSKVEDFIAKYNAVQSLIEKQTQVSTSSGGKVSASILAGNREITDISKQLRNQIFAAVPGLYGSVQRLEHIGIDFKTGTSELEIKDATKLDAALRDNGDDVRTLFGDTGDGLVTRIDSFVTRITGTSGTLTTQTATLTKQATNIDEQIATMERRLAQQQALLEQSFIRMEEAQQGIQNQLAALNNAFGTSSSK